MDGAALVASAVRSAVTARAPRRTVAAVTSAAICACFQARVSAEGIANAASPDAAPSRAKSAAHVARLRRKRAGRRLRKKENIKAAIPPDAAPDVGTRNGHGTGMDLDAGEPFDTSAGAAAPPAFVPPQRVGAKRGHSDGVPAVPPREPMDTTTACSSGTTTALGAHSTIKHEIDIGSLVTCVAPSKKSGVTGQVHAFHENQVHMMIQVTGSPYANIPVGEFLMLTRSEVQLTPQ